MLDAPVLINSVRGEFLVDSGSPVTLISYEYFESLGDRKPDLRSVETTLTSAGGNSLEVIGKSEFRIKLDKQFRTITKSLLSN